MKNRLLITTMTLAFIGTSTCFAQKLTFTYDAAGNQTQRKWEALILLTPVKLVKINSTHLSQKPLANTNMIDPKSLRYENKSIVHRSSFRLDHRT